MTHSNSLTIELPVEVERQLQAEWGEQHINRRILEAIALEGYRSEALSIGQIAEFLQLSLSETEELLTRHATCEARMKRNQRGSLPTHTHIHGSTTGRVETPFVIARLKVDADPQ